MILKKGRLLVFLTLLLLLFVFHSSAFAYTDGSGTVDKLFEQGPPQESDNVPITQPDADTPGFTSLLIRTVLILLLIVSLMYGLSRWITKRGKIFDTNQFIKVKSGVNLGQNKSLRLVKVGSSYYLLGIGNDITLLKEFSSEEEVNEIEMLQQTTSDNIMSSSTQVWSNLRSLFSKKEQQQAHSFQSQLEERLTDLKGTKLVSNNHRNMDDRQQNRGELNQ